LLTLAEVRSISGQVGDFRVQVRQYPRYVDLDKCIACGECARRCPRKVPDEFNRGWDQRKAIYLKYSQAVPLKYVIDADHCIFFEKGKCRACEKFCPTGAVNFEDQERDLDLEVGAVIMALGSDVTDPAAARVFGYELYPNVMTALAFERMLSASGPFQGHIVRPSDKQPPKKIAWIQCVGSRDVHEGSKPYCSAVCCTYAVKEAIMAKEHVRGLDAAVFYMDMRTYGKDFDRYYERAKNSLGVRFIRSRVPSLRRLPETEEILISYLDESGRFREEKFDLVVLSTGFVTSPESVGLIDRLGIERDAHGFPVTDSFHPVGSSRPGVLVCGALQAPKDIPASVVDASAAAGLAGAVLAEARHTRTRTEEKPAETEVNGLPPRIGVFVCRCGTNIAAVVDVPAVVEFARGLPFVEYVEENLFTCSQDTQDLMAKAIKEHNLNRIVVAACTPRTHEAIFQDTLMGAGLNKYLFEMANIRNQCSWVHADAPDKATEKAKELVRMAVAKAALLRPLKETEFEIVQEALVVGGGAAGMTAALTLADQGFRTHLVEKTGRLGGQALKIDRTWRNEDVPAELGRLIETVRGHGKISVYLDTEITRVEGSVGRFRTTVRRDGREEVIEHGAAVIATGAAEYQPGEYLYGRTPRVMTGLDLEKKLVEEPDSFRTIDTAVFVQCVGSRIPERPYCSKVCCSRSVINAMRLLDLNPAAKVYIVYRDVRTYGFRETIYSQARQRGVRFIRYDHEKGLTVDDDADGLKLVLTDEVLGRKVLLRSDLLILAAAMTAPKKNPLAQMFKVPINDDGFFVEAHAKLRPVDFATDGVFVCGLAHAPKPLDESIAQAQAAAARAATVLSQPMTRVGGIVAEINKWRCTGCGVCVDVCPYQAIQLNDELKAEVNEALCKGCGTCAASCRSGAPSLKGFTNQEVFAQIAAC